MDFLKVKTLMPQDGTKIKVEILKDLGEQEEDRWGNKPHAYDVKVNDKDLYRWNASPNQVQKYNDCGINPFVMKRWDGNGKTGFNFLAEDDINALDHNCKPNVESAVIEKNIQTGQDDFADKVSRGASWNNSISYTLDKGEFKDLESFMEEVKKNAEVIAKHQKAFVNNERPDCPPEALEKGKEIFKSDLPF